MCTNAIQLPSPPESFQRAWCFYPRERENERKRDLNLEEIKGGCRQWCSRCREMASCVTMGGESPWLTFGQGDFNCSGRQPPTSFLQNAWTTQWVMLWLADGNWPQRFYLFYPSMACVMLQVKWPFVSSQLGPPPHMNELLVMLKMAGLSPIDKLMSLTCNWCHIKKMFTSVVLMLIYLGH